MHSTDPPFQETAELCVHFLRLLLVVLQGQIGEPSQGSLSWKSRKRGREIVGKSGQVLGEGTDLIALYDSYTWCVLRNDTRHWMRDCVRPTHCLTDSLACSLTHSLTCTLSQSVAHSITDSLTHSPTHLLTHSLTHSPTHPPTHSITFPPTHPPTHSLTH